MGSNAQIFPDPLRYAGAIVKSGLAAGGPGIWIGAGVQQRLADSRGDRGLCPSVPGTRQHGMAELILRRDIRTEANHAVRDAWVDVK